ncbi:9348_t:CDS:2, partial [Entrophospora sp. SA101]
SDLSSMATSRTIYNTLHSIREERLDGHEKEADYEWALTCISKIFNGMSHPKVIVTDRELALMNAIGRIFPEEDWTEFIELWKAVTASITEQDFTTKWKEFLECYA